MRKLYARLGYDGSRHCDWIDTRVFWSDVLTSHAARVAERLRIEPKIKTVVEQSRARLTVNEEFKIRFFVGRRAPKRYPGESPLESPSRKTRAGILILLRLNEIKKAVEDYIVMPAHAGPGTERELRFRR